MKRWIVGVAVLMIAAVSFGQTSRPAGVLVRLGSFFPSALQARNEGNNWVVLGVQVDIGKWPGMAMGKGSLAISADSYQKGDLSALPVLLNYVTKNENIVFTAGAGASYDREARFTINGVQKTKRFEFAWQLGLGYDLEKYKIPGLVELRYLGNGYDTLSGFAVSFGLRF